jgi:protein-disulfide isomerase
MNKINAVYVSLVALVVALAALVMCIVCCSSKGGANVEEALKEKPELVIQAMQAYDAKQREEALKQVEENLKANAEELNNRADDGVIGNPEGKMVLVEFFDFSCGYCHRVYPALKEIIANNPDVKVVAKPMTFLSPASKYAAEAALAAKEQGKFAEVYAALFSAEGRLTEEKINELVAATGVDMEKIKADMKSEKVQNTLNSVSELAGKIQVSGVPTLVFNNKILQTLDASVIQEAIDAAK